MSENGASHPAPSGTEPPADADPFRYGWRFVRQRLADGHETLEQVPLTLEDVLHPQEEDHVVENSLHERECERGYLTWAFRSRLDRLDRGSVLSDCIINWGVPGLGNH